MARSLSNLVDNLAERNHNIKCKYENDFKKCVTYGVKYSDCECYLEYTNIKDDLILYKWLCCNGIIKNKFVEKNKYEFSKHLLRKSV